jgi:hypothetical protein
MRVERNLVFPPSDWIPGHAEISAGVAPHRAPSAPESGTDLSWCFIVYYANR